MEMPRSDQPAFYRITVAGQLDEGWADHCRGLTICNHGEMEASCATLTGRFPDQAALLGVLNALYDGHRVVLSVERLNVIESYRESSLGETND